MLVVADETRLEPALEQVADASVACVEPGRVEAVQPLHPLRERRLAALDQQVEVVPHQAVGVEPPAVAVDDVPQDAEEPAPVVLVEVDQPAVDAAGGQVVRAVAERQTERAGHAATVAAP
jgi:hypothetical protein